MARSSSGDETKALEASSDVRDEGLQHPGLLPATQLACDGLLDSLRQSHGVVSTVLLREPGAAEATPVVALQSPEMPAGANDGGRYRLLGEIARGGMGAILKGHDAHLGRDLAFKVLLEAHKDRPEMLRRFVEEAQIAGQLQHPGIVPVYELGRFSGQRLYFTMKLVHGRTLAALLEARSSAIRVDTANPSATSTAQAGSGLTELLRIFEQVCQTMGYAHARGVIHRDLKPSNIMVGPFGEVQVMDWGLAKVLKAGGVADERRANRSHSDQCEIQTVRSLGEGLESVAGSVMGTPAYMPPEQACGEVETLDERSDVFGLGAILCEILTGKPPYCGESSGEVYRKAAAGDITEAARRLDVCGADAELIALAKACLASDRRHRPRDAGVVTRELNAYLSSVETRLRTAELARAAEQARAEEAQATAEQERKARTAAQAHAAAERRARRLSVALAASFLGTVLLGGGGWVWFDLQHKARLAESERKVNLALQDAALRRGEAKTAPVNDLAKWGDALAAAKRAETLLAAVEVSNETAVRVRALLAQVQIEDAAARQAAAESDRDRRMLERLEEIRAGRGDESDCVNSEASYAEAFRDYGIDMLSAGSSDSAARIAARPCAAELAAALDDWTWRRRQRDTNPTRERGQPQAPLDASSDPSGWRKLQELAKAADPDPWRTQLRDAMAQDDRARLEELAATTDVAHQPVQSLHLLAMRLGESGDPARSVALLRDAHREHPNDLWINFYLARFLSELKPPALDETIRYYTAARAIRPTNGGVLNNLGAALAGSGRLDAAIDAFRDAIRFHPDLAVAHSNLGAALTTKGDLDDAIAACREAIRLRPENAESHYNLANALFRKGSLDESIAENREAIRIEPRLAPAHYNLGHALRRSGAFPDAIAAFREAIHLKPDFVEAYVTLGNTLQITGALDEAIDAYREAIRLKPDYALAYCNLGHALQAQKHFAEALDAFRRGHELGSQDPRWSYPSAQWIRDCERFVEAHNDK